MPTPFRATRLPITGPEQVDNPRTVAQAANLEGRRLERSMNQGGGTVAARRTVSADTNISSTDTFVFGDTTAGAVTLTLPKAAKYPFSNFCIKRVAGANTLTLAARSGETIDGSASVSITAAQWVVPANLTTWTVV